MPFVEVSASEVPEERKQLIGEQLVAAVMDGEGAANSPAARAISWLVWHELSAWSIGGQPVSPTEAPWHLSRIPVPAGSLTEQRNAQIIRRVTAVLAAADDQPGRFYQIPSPGAGHRHRRGRAEGFRCSSRDHQLRHDRRRRPELATSHCYGIDR
jgi:phenylpyruvate tautomerase PptA (4-oxalocrotonate tautomerase family)